MTNIRNLPIRLHLAWQQFKADERGAQTLEWLALALLLLAILGTATSLTGTGFGQALKDKFIGLVDNIDKK